MKNKIEAVKPVNETLNIRLMGSKYCVEEIELKLNIYPFMPSLRWGIIY